MQSFESEDKENNVDMEKQHHSDSGLDSSDSRPSEQQRTIKDEVTESVQLLKSLAITDKQREDQPTQDDIVLPSPTEEALEDLLSIIPQVWYNANNNNQSLMFNFTVAQWKRRSIEHDLC